MSIGFTKADLRAIYTLLSRMLPPMNATPFTTEEIVLAGSIVAKTRALVADGLGEVERGAKVFEWRLPQKDAPTQNEIRGFVFRNPFIMKGIEKRIDKDLMAIVEATPGARVHGPSRRWVRVTRFTPQPNAIDDPRAIDALGGKCAVDALVRCDVLVDDTPKFCVREGHVMKTTKGNVHLLVEVFETAEEEVPADPPKDAPVEQRKKRKRGPAAQHIVDASGGEPPPPPRATRPGLRSLPFGEK